MNTLEQSTHEAEGAPETFILIDADELETLRRAARVLDAVRARGYTGLRFETVGSHSLHGIGRVVGIADVVADQLFDVVNCASSFIPTHAPEADATLKRWRDEIDAEDPS